MKTIVLANAKGGTGKTTVAVNLSACLALHHGKRVLGIDLDPQGNFGISYGIDPRQIELTSYHMLTSEAPQVRDYITEVKPNLHIIPNAIAPDLENRLEASHNRDSLLRLRLRQLRGQYDYVIIDTPPAMRTATMNATWRPTRSSSSWTAASTRSTASRTSCGKSLASRTPTRRVTWSSAAS